jgi:hypothetical protein
MAYTNIDDPSAYFQTKIWTGNAQTNRTITNDGNSDLQPDMLWAKSRSSVTQHVIYDSTRGAGKPLLPNVTNAEGTDATGYNLTGFATDGFITGANQFNLISGGNEYAAWQWKANGGTTSSNTDGTITSTVQANTDAGFSIVTYGGTASANTVGHGLADTPDVIIFKNRSAANIWAVYHQSLGNNLKLVLNASDAQDADGAFMNGTLPTSSVFSVGASVNTNGSGSNYVAYCFASKQGYSKFGSYIGNGNADGTFVYTGFKPAWVMTKETGASGAWVMYDNKRSTTANPQDKYFSANTADAEATFTQYDFLSNGFKFRTSGSENSNGNTHIYMAFAENPFVTSTGIPTTAR